MNHVIRYPNRLLHLLNMFGHPVALRDFYSQFIHKTTGWPNTHYKSTSTYTCSSLYYDIVIMMKMLLICETQSKCQFNYDLKSDKVEKKSEK